MKRTENCQVPVVPANLSDLVQEPRQLVGQGGLSDGTETTGTAAASDRSPGRKPAAGTGNPAKS